MTVIDLTIRGLYKIRGTYTRRRRLMRLGWPGATTLLVLEASIGLLEWWETRK
jgi:hypothetical protein